jgi:hypothetical protein
MAVYIHAVVKNAYDFDPFGGLTIKDEMFSHMVFEQKTIRPIKYPWNGRSPRDKFLSKDEHTRLLKVTEDKAFVDLAKGRSTWVRRWMLVELALFSGLRSFEKKEEFTLTPKGNGKNNEGKGNNFAAGGKKR